MKHAPLLRHVLSGLVLALCGAGAAFAQAGLPGGASSLSETHGAWTVMCATAAEGARCTISHGQSSAETGQRLLAIELAAASGGGEATGVLALPFGLRLDEGVALQVDDQPALMALRFSTCLPVGCLVPLSLDAAAVTALRQGSELSVSAVAHDNGQPIGLSISLAGFSSGLDRLAQLEGS